MLAGFLRTCPADRHGANGLQTGRATQAEDAREDVQAGIAQGGVAVTRLGDLQRALAALHLELRVLEELVGLGLGAGAYLERDLHAGDRVIAAVDRDVRDRHAQREVPAGTDRVLELLRPNEDRHQEPPAGSGRHASARGVTIAPDDDHAPPAVHTRA
ncbi:MAG: hypothetical protein ABI841_03170 [Chloroflexota bacterium]